jgi:hypothetical protein
MKNIFILFTLCTFIFGLAASGETRPPKKRALAEEITLQAKGPKASKTSDAIISLIGLGDSLIAVSANGSVQGWFNNFEKHTLFPLLATQEKLLNVHKSHDNKYVFAYQSGTLILRSLEVNKMNKEEQLTSSEKDTYLTSSCPIGSPCSYLITGNNQGTIKSWDLASKKVTRSYTIHTAPITALCITNDYHTISASEDRTVKVWNPKEKKCIRTFSIPQPTAILHALGSNFLVGCENKIILRSVTQDIPSKEYKLNSNITTISTCKDLITVGCSDGTITLFNNQLQPSSPTLTCHTSAVTAIILLTPTCFASGSETGEIHVWRQKGTSWELVKKLSTIHKGTPKKQESKKKVQEVPQPKKRGKYIIYSCADCDNREFVGRGNYNTHRARMHQEGTLLECEYCDDYTTRVKADLKRHVEKKHPKKYTSFLQALRKPQKQKKARTEKERSLLKKQEVSESESSSSDNDEESPVQSDTNEREAEQAESISSSDDESQDHSSSLIEISKLLQERTERLQVLSEALINLKTRYELTEQRITLLLQKKEGSSNQLIK